MHSDHHAAGPEIGDLRLRLVADRAWLRLGLPVLRCRAGPLDYMGRAGQRARGHQRADLGAELRLCHEDFGASQSKTWPHSWHLIPTCSSAFSTRSMDIRIAMCAPAGHSILTIPSALSLRLCSSLSIVSSSAETSLNVISISFPFGGVIAGILRGFAVLARRRGNAREPEETLDLSPGGPNGPRTLLYSDIPR